MTDGTVFREILQALQTEGAGNTTIAGWAQKLNDNMAARAAQWSKEEFPYGSEFNFGDSFYFLFLFHDYRLFLETTWPDDSSHVMCL